MESNNLVLVGSLRSSTLVNYSDGYHYLTRLTEPNNIVLVEFMGSSS